MAWTTVRRHWHPPSCGRHSRRPNRSDSVKSLLGAPTIITGVVPPAVSGTVGRNFAAHCWLTLGAVLLTGVGVSGTFQLATTWAAELVPQREGTASTVIVAFAALGLCCLALDGRDCHCPQFLRYDEMGCRRGCALSDPYVPSHAGAQDTIARGICVVCRSESDPTNLHDR